MREHGGAGLCSFVALRLQGELQSFVNCPRGSDVLVGSANYKSHTDENQTRHL